MGLLKEKRKTKKEKRRVQTCLAASARTTFISSFLFFISCRKASLAL